MLYSNHRRSQTRRQVNTKKGIGFLDNRQIAFITCVNNETEYEECCYYLDRLRIPDGYRMDRIAIRKAPSMAAGYHAAMQSSPAKYKIYLHQDVFVKNKDLIADLIAVFTSQKQIGLLGVVGRTEEETGADRIMRWNTGKIEDNLQPLFFPSPPQEALFTEVKAIDGLFLATQYDLPWREDLFDGWDFYDISQCMEFRRNGYRIAVAEQKDAWCYHDCAYPDFRHYYDYYRIFAREYSDLISAFFQEDPAVLAEYERKKEFAAHAQNLKKSLELLFDAGRKAELRTLFQELPAQGGLLLREYECIVRIDRQEEEEASPVRFWDGPLPCSRLLFKLRTLKYALKRIEYHSDFPEKDFLSARYSACAIREVCERYCLHKEEVLSRLRENLFQT